MRGETFVRRDYDIFAGLDVDKRSISVTFADHKGLLKSGAHAVWRGASGESRAQALSRSEDSLCLRAWTDRLRLV